MRTRTAALTLASLALLALLSAPLLAHPPGEGDRPRHGRMLATFLELDPEQKEAARQLRQEFRDQVQPLREEIGARRDELRTALDAARPDATRIGQIMLSIHATRERIEAAREELDRDFAALLTPEQRSRWETFQDARRSRRHERGFGRRGGRR